MGRLQFNFAPGSKTKRGKPQSTRIVTPDHEAFKLYQKGKELQIADGIEDERVDPKYIDKAVELMKEEYEKSLKNK